MISTPRAGRQQLEAQLVAHLGLGGRHGLLRGVESLPKRGFPPRFRRKRRGRQTQTSSVDLCGNENVELNNPGTREDAKHSRMSLMPPEYRALVGFHTGASFSRSRGSSKTSSNCFAQPTKCSEIFARSGVTFVMRASNQQPVVCEIFLDGTHTVRGQDPRGGVADVGAAPFPGGASREFPGPAPEDAMFDIIQNTKTCVITKRWVSADPSQPNTVEFWLRISQVQKNKRNHGVDVDGE